QEPSRWHDPDARGLKAMNSGLNTEVLLSLGRGIGELQWSGDHRRNRHDPSVQPRAGQSSVWFSRPACQKPCSRPLSTSAILRGPAPAPRIPHKEMILIVAETGVA